MGVCLSRCGDAQQKAGVVAATISHQNSLDLKSSEFYGSNRSLKKFLHLYEIAEAKKSLSSPRASLGESLQIPHSSELFSLPDSDAERPSCCISPSPARTSRTSLSSRATTSPKSTRNSFSIWSARVSTDRSVSVGCRKKIRPARSSKSLAGDQETAAHHRLVEAIARLERLNGGKNPDQLRGSSFCSSDLDVDTKKSQAQILSKSRSGEEKQSRHSASGIHHGRHSRHSRHGRDYQPYQPPHSTTFPKIISNDQSHPHICGDQSDDTSHCCSRTHNPGSTKRISNCAADPLSMLRRQESLNSTKPTSLDSIPTSTTKQMPLEKSVTNFLKEVENFVSLIEAPRLSLSSEAAEESKNIGHPCEPLIVSKSARSIENVRESVSRLSSCRFEDADNDEQFTFFEATFDGCDQVRKKETSALAKSLQRLAKRAAHEEHGRTSEKPLDAEKAQAALLPILNSDVETLKETQLSNQNSNPAPDVVAKPAKSPAKISPTETSLVIYVDPGIESKPRVKVDTTRPAPTEINPNVMPMTKRSPTVNKSPLKMRAQRVFRRGFSRSLDSRDGSVTKVDFNIFRNGSIQVVPCLASKASETAHTNEAAISTEAITSTELALIPVSNTSSPDGQLEDAVCERKELN